MKITIAKNAGFCFGVKRAIDEVKKILGGGSSKIYSIGPIIHNEVVTNELKRNGLIELNDKNDIERIKNAKVVIRTHGIEESVYNKLNSNGNEIIDLTCPFVERIHRLVKEYSSIGYKVIVIGDKNHPEVKGIISYAKNDAYVVANGDDIKALNIDKSDKILVVFQTTTSVINGQKLVDILKELFYNCIIENTICNATELRQEEVKELAKVSDAMIIVGSMTSSNTKKLYEISKSYCKRTYMISTKSDIMNVDIRNIKKIGVSAGASTPKYLIEEIIEKWQK